MTWIVREDHHFKNRYLNTDNWNSLRLTIKEIDSLGTFRNKLLHVDLSSSLIGSTFDKS